MAASGAGVGPGDFVGADLPPGGPGNDTLTGGSGGDSLAGLEGDDLINGGPGAGADTLSGGPGDDTLEGGRGDDLIDGGNGFDTLVFTGATSGVFATLETSHSISFDTLLGEDTLVSVENVVGTGFNDILYGDAAPNRLSGEGGNDNLKGGFSDDTLSGGAGADTLDGGDGVDRIVGGAGVDIMTGGGDLDIFEFSAGDSPWKGLVTDLDRIRDFGDIMLLRGGPPPTAANYIEAENNFVDPRTQAEEFYAKGYEYIAIQVGANIHFFAPRLNVGVIFENNSLNFISLTNFRTEAPNIAPTSTATMGDDALAGVGNDTIDGLAGADTITEIGGTNYLRGGDGGDSITGGAGFDDINGNAGNDTCVSGGGDDWVVGGRDNDSLVGSAGQNLVYGNLGNDTCEGGDGTDIVRGGQDNDVLNGGAGDDYVSGDKGSDTVTGGAGADVFHTFGDAGVDRVLDFSLAQGDRVQVDPGTRYTVSQVGADTVIDMTGGGQMILVGVQMSSLTAGWIFGA
ncbi:calcium-binding protein [Phenylobacterium sp.]|uniref:calcium-binding protein n=1 Tax=Phenylobacterium sp. TaxID=1871053 RepID=UPI0025E1B64B|nr:calcium-binding protein [Phenylobacterium sp.]